MVKFFLSLLVLVFMPFRLLMVFIVFLAILLIFIVDSFIYKDTYYYASTEFLGRAETAKNMLEKACGTQFKCTMTLYARGGKGALLETFHETINENKTGKQQKKGFIEKVVQPIQKAINSSDVKKSIKRADLSFENKCGEHEKSGGVICVSPELVMVFRSGECTVCAEEIKRQFSRLEQKKYKSFLIKMAHAAHDWVLKLFGKEDAAAERANIQGKIKEFAVKSAIKSDSIAEIFDGVVTND